MNTASDLPQHPERVDVPFVIGTAGHVDHGKSTLVRALTGIDPDRLAEERQREMTIDLGFAWSALPDGRSVSIIDVPGHERFVRNMLAGVGGIDLALLVVAADDGPMPQTREHLAILDLLGVERGVVAVTRTDLVDDEWRELVIEETRELLHATTLANAPVLPVSAVTGEGLDALRAALANELDLSTARDAGGNTRLSIDRVFHMRGFGTVVTGTLVGGEVRIGQELMLYPEKQIVRVRGVQAHRRQVEQARAGSRVALNLSGVDLDELHRGNVIASPGSLQPSLRLDSRVRVLDDAPVALTQNDEVIVFIGSAETPARLSLLDREEIGPGDEGWVQLRLAHPVAALRRDRLILRRPSPAITIGGGSVVDPAPPRHKRFRADLIATLEVLQQGSPDELIIQALADQALGVPALARATGVQEIGPVIDEMLAGGELTLLGDDERGSDTTVMRSSVFRAHMEATARFLSAWHERHPLSPGANRDSLRAAIEVGSQRVLDDLLRAFERDELVRLEGPIVAMPEFTITLGDAHRATADAFLQAARANPFSPPPPESFGVGDDLLTALAVTGEIVPVADQIAYPAEVFAQIQETVLDMLDRDGEITLAGYRDRFGTSRKFAQPTLEHLDELRVTRRRGDVRVRLRSRSGGN